jgi:excisionase family DNA binding protein
MTPEEAAVFLRMSRSTIYQRPDIPRHRLPGSRQIRFLRSELLAWIKGESLGQQEAGGTENDHKALLPLAGMTTPVYHRNPRYR